MSDKDSEQEDKQNRPETIASETIPDAEIVERSTPPSPRQPQSGGSGFVSGLLGAGLVVAGGFGLLQVMPGLLPTADTSAMEQLIAQQSQEIDKLKSQINEFATRPVFDPSEELATLRAGLEEKLAETSAAADPSAAVAKATESLQSAIAAIDARLTDVEKRPAGPGGEASSTALAAYDREIKSLRDQIASLGSGNSDAAAQIASAATEAKSQIDAVVEQAKQANAQASAAAQKLATGAALNRLTAALEAGGSFSSAVSELTAAGITVPASIADRAEAGVSTMADLQRRFPDAARAALDAALRSSVNETWTDRVTAFLRTQTGARSLQPREGNDPDAILSRAEAGMQAGNLSAALTEIGTLSESAQAAMADWVADANARLAATQALPELTSAVDAK
ncbi:MAG: hypothetical protein DI533_11140 [Cereibacter sphaeroides]|uniref:Mitochondrial inner membrane protein n=1 Tax=Cereibacter sphaeroides TaxID=1063 RepID=A0A2W5S400_CERSP|nr:MAG: hypothetical protein DI533_11140 [Cereibacter sphaeroides]